MENRDIKIAVGVVTYNHAEYIKECLDSILSQQTDYSFQIIVCDDGSTDNTPLILKEYKSMYPDVVKLHLSSQNKGVGENYRILFEDLKSYTYAMLCEGDDYWINPLKIERQVGFMERYPDYGFVSGRVLWKKSRYYEERPPFMGFDDRPSFDILPVDEGGKHSFETYGNVGEWAIGGPITHTSALAFKTEILSPFLSELGLGFDMALQAILANFTNFAIMQDIVSVYRYNVGIYSDKQNFLKRTYYWENFWLPARKCVIKILSDKCPWTIDEVEDAYTYCKLKYYITIVR